MKGDVENHDKGHVEFIRTGHTGEIYIHDIAYSAGTDEKLSKIEDFEMPVDIIHLSTTSMQRDQIKTFFYNYSDIFSKSDTDTGYTKTVKHKRGRKIPKG